METLNPQTFVHKWRSAQLKERAAAQEHFIDLCRLIGHPTPAEDDPSGTRFAFEAGANKQSGGSGWADVWKRGYFAWEYKGKHANLDKAYAQLLQYREALHNPPLLIVSDIEQIVIHSNFTNTVKQVVTIKLADLLTPDGQRHLRNLFYAPESFRAQLTTEQVTQAAAREFARLADHLRPQAEPEAIAHFLIRLLFCLFAEDIELLPPNLFTRMLGLARRNNKEAPNLLSQLFGVMATGGYFGVEAIRHFNGGLFNHAQALPLDHAALEILHQVAALDWSNIEPSIFGTLFERSLDPAKRAQLGAHYTSRADILLIVEPVLMQPLRRRWATVQQQARDLAQRRDGSADRATRTRRQNELEALLRAFADELASIRVLDPACGSGNFLYVALKQLLDLEKEISVFAGELGLTAFFPQVSPSQLYGIEINAYAHELAQATVWIGYIQWFHANGYGFPAEPILKPLDNIRHMDAILAYDGAGQPVEPVWPAAEVIIGNPPFLGGKLLRFELGDKYVDSLFALYTDKVNREADLVSYWFEKCRKLLVESKLQRTGLLATNSIRQQVNQPVLRKIKESGDIFMAWSDRPWILNGADVRVSMVGFDDGSEEVRAIDGKIVPRINADLSSSVDVKVAQPLKENQGICLRADEKGGSFEITDSIAKEMITSPINVNRKSNSAVIFPWLTGRDIVQRSRNMWIIDFGVNTSLEDASQFELPFDYVQKHVKPERLGNRIARLSEKWWLHRIPGAEMRRKLAKLARFIATPVTSKYRIFAWVHNPALPDITLSVFASDSDYVFGVLHSKVHELWSLKMCAWMGVGNDPRYTPTTCFETFPFPWSPGQEPADDPRVAAIAQAAQELVAKRDNWLNPPGLEGKELQKRTLTNLYNQRPTWLDLAHKKLDAAVFAAYGWPVDLGEEEILARLLALNLQRAGVV